MSYSHENGRFILLHALVHVFMRARVTRRTTGCKELTKHVDCPQSNHYHAYEDTITSYSLYIAFRAF